MAISLYSGFVPVCLQLLGGLKTVLQKAEEHATAQKWDTATVLNLRLYPDMFTLERQVRQVCNHALSAGRVAGVALPSLPDQDNSWAEIQSRIDKTVDFLKELRPRRARRTGRFRQRRWDLRRCVKCSENLLGHVPSIQGLTQSIFRAQRWQSVLYRRSRAVAIESGALEGVRGSYRLLKPIERMQVPTTVQAD